MPFITVEELPDSLRSADMIDVMVDGANAKAARVAPCLTWADEDVDHPAPTAGQVDEARLVLIGAVKRWVEAGAGALQAQTAGPFGITMDTRQKGGFNLWPSEIEQLQDICKGENAGAFSIDTAGCATVHADICTLNLGGSYCSCGADIAGFPLYEIAP